MKLFEKMIEKEDIFEGKVIHVTLEKAELPDGTMAMREVVGHPGGVCVSALTEDNELLFVRQFRYPYKEVLLELPAGKLEKGQNPLENGKRELLEETGAIGYNYISLGSQMVSPGFCNEVVHMYMCRVERFEEQQLDEGEFLNFEKIPIDKAVEMVLNNQLPDAKTQIAVLQTKLLLDSGKI